MTKRLLWLLPLLALLIIPSAGWLRVTQLSGFGAAMLDAEPPSVFLPTDLSDLGLWLDAADPSTLFQTALGDDLVDPDGGVGRWEDKSGHARHASQNTSNARPLRIAEGRNGRDVLFFDGSNDRLVTQTFSSVAQPNTVFIVGRHRSYLAGSLPSPFVDGVLVDARHYVGAASNIYVMDAGASLTGGSPTTSWHIFRAEFDGSTSRLLRDGSQVASGNVGAAGWRGFSIAARYLNDRHAAIDLGEIIVYARILDAEEIILVQAYLQAKWGTPALP